MATQTKRKKVYPDGGSIKPPKITVKSKDDPRYIAYNDSLALYNNYKELTTELKKQGYPLNKSRKMGVAEITNPSFFTKMSKTGASKADATTTKKSWEKHKKHVERTGLSKPISPTLYETPDFITGIINKTLPKQIYSNTIEPIGYDNYFYPVPEKLRDSFINNMLRNRKKETIENYNKRTGDYRPADQRIVANYSNVNPKQEVVYNAPLEVKKQILPIKSKVQSLRGQMEGTDIKQNNINGEINKKPLEPKQTAIPYNVSGYRGEGETKQDTWSKRQGTQELKLEEAQNKINTMRKKVTTTKVPKLIWGQLIGMAANTGMSLLAANKAKKEQRRATLEAQNMAMANQSEVDRLALEEFPEQGLGNVSYYQKKGGKLATPTYATKGGKLNPISSDMEIAEGNTHEESKIDNTTGIKLLKGNKAFAEIEDKETIKNGSMVYSDTSTVDGKMTYAEAAAKLARAKGKLEKDLNTGDKISRQTNTRKLALIDQTENALFMKQELEKKGTSKETNASIPKGKNGLDFKDTKFGKGLANVLPFADNLVNAYLTSQTPKVPKPNLQKYNKLKTTHNANPELAAINDAETAASTFIESNTSSSATARNEIAGVRLRGAQQKGQVLAQKENIETGLINADTLNKQAVTTGNLAKMDAYGTQNMQRAGDIQQRISANVANAVGDIVDKKNFDAEMAYKKEQLDVARQYSVNGTSERADLINPTEIAKITSDPVYAAEQVKRYANRPKELEELYKRVPHLRPAGTKVLATPNL